MRRVLRIFIWIAGILAGMTVLIGLAHLPAARPLLALMGGIPGCPVSLDGADPIKTEALRREALKKKEGSETPKSMPASLFTLSQSRNDVSKLLEASASDCETVREGSVIRCAQLRLPNDRVVEDAHLQFDERDRLVAVDLQSEDPCAPDILEELHRLTSDLENRVGPVTVSHGEATPEFLTGAPFRRVASEFRYKGYNAKLVALRTPSGLRLRQTYQWVPAS